MPYKDSGKNREANRKSYEKHKAKRLLRTKEYYLKNRNKYLEWNKQWAETHKDQHKKSSRKCNLKRDYDLTVAQYDFMLKSQDGKCAICGAAVKLCVDHDHNDKFVRGILCRRCNSGLGFFRDSTTYLAEAIRYLEKSYPWNR